jgi:FSR family fosmidomycin resistance protein-like MFS transporter
MANTTTTVLKRRGRQFSLFIIILLAIELLDEFVFGLEGAAMPLIRDDFQLDYVQIGLLLSLPKLGGVFIEPIIGLLGDTRWRKTLILGGGVGFALALFLTGVSQTFGLLLFSFLLFYPSSGAFVGLAQAALMDSDPERHEYNMARWTFAGSLGVVGGSLTLGFATGIGIDWRTLFLAMVFFTLVLVVLAARYRFIPGAPDDKEDTDDEDETLTFGESARRAWQALRRVEVLRWLILLEFGDLMLDVLLGYLALYFVDVVGLSEGEAAGAVAVWTVVGLLGDFALIFVLERIKGLTYLRYSSALQLVLYPMFLLVPGLLPKLIILGLLGFFNAGWYAILRGELYSSMPGQSATVMTLDNIVGFAAGLLPFILGFIAEQFGLLPAMWCLLAGPIALLIGVPYRKSNKTEER